MGEPSLRTTQSEDRLDSWEEIAAYLKRDVTTVQRWEKRRRCPSTVTCMTSLPSWIFTISISRLTVVTWSSEGSNVVLLDLPRP